MVENLNDLPDRFTYLVGWARNERAKLNRKLKKVDNELSGEKINNLTMGLTSFANACVASVEIYNFYLTAMINKISNNTEEVGKIKEKLKIDLATKSSNILVYQFFISTFSGIEFSCKNYVKWKIDLPEFKNAKKKFSEGRFLTLYKDILEPSNGTLVSELDFQKLDFFRKLRNYVVHNNGLVEKDFSGYDFGFRISAKKGEMVRSENLTSLVDAVEELVKIFISWMNNVIQK